MLCLIKCFDAMLNLSMGLTEEVRKTNVRTKTRGG